MYLGVGEGDRQNDYTMGTKTAFELGNSKLTRGNFVLLLHIALINMLSFLLVLKSKIPYAIWKIIHSPI